MSGRNVITVRSARSGRQLAGGLHKKNRSDPGEGPIVILIHGYQNSEEKAYRSYLDFQWAIRHALPPGTERRMGTYWEFHWPGDHWAGFVSASTYPARVGVAIDAGGRLARRFLHKLPPERSVRIVAHSLGCRVALQAIRTIREMEAEEEEADRYRGPPVEAVFLLAAAVPEQLCVAVPEHELPDREEEWYPAPLDECAEHVYFSRSDRALSVAFRPGQYLFGERGRAVGRNGLPNPRWTSRNDTGLDHGEYWSSPKVAASVAWRLRLRNLRPLEIRELPVNPLRSDVRTVERRPLASQPLAVRVPG